MLKSNKQKSLRFIFGDVLSKATTLLGRQKDRCLSVRMLVNEQEISLYLILENPFWKSGVNPHHSLREETTSLVHR